jgi:hypothetical protein
MNGTICKGRGVKDIEEKLSLAMTVNPWLKAEDNNDPRELRRPSQLQLCPWFVDWIGERKLKNQSQVMKVFFGKGLIKLAGKLPFSFAQIGSYHLQAQNCAY